MAALAKTDSSLVAGDKIMVRQLTVHNIIGVDSWERSKRQPLTIDLTVHQQVDASGDTDLLSQTISYGTVSKTVQEFSEKTSYRSVEALAAGIARVCVEKCGAPRVTVRVEKPRALLHAACAGVQITRTKEEIGAMGSDGLGEAYQDQAEDREGEDQIFIKDLTLSTIIGVNPWEREERQRVVITLIIHLALDPQVLLSDHVPKVHNYRTITRTVSKYVESTNYKTVEALATSIARLLIKQCHVPKVTVRVEKPSAIVFAAAAGVEITRDRAYFGEKARASDPTPATSLDASAHSDDVDEETRGRLPHVVYLALGSNLGDSAKNINDAVTSLAGSAAIKVIDTSFLYETKAMYVTDQPNFINACCAIRTSLSPNDLLDFLKGIEAEMGRNFNGQRFGPRPIDLDILVYDRVEMSTERLIIPHPRIKEREFVLRPFADIAPDMEIPGLFRTVSQLLALLSHESAPTPSDKIRKVIPLKTTAGLWSWSTQTYIMGILNVTPDSFSDGGDAHTQSPDAAAQQAIKMAAAGAHIIDVGGMSTRPGADEPPVEIEIGRVVPVIEAIRKLDANIPISIDTYRAPVARAAIKAGANFINDVSGGSLDPDMITAMAETQVPVCLMHMRGTPKTMQQLTDYPAGQVVPTIAASLTSTVQQAMNKGVRRWNIILDPGIGFVKTGAQNYEILQKLPVLVGEAAPATATLDSEGQQQAPAARNALAGFPVLVGPSRKGFLSQGAVTGSQALDATSKKEQAKQRIYATAAACSAAIARGANVLRVHDVEEMADVVRVADRCFRDL
ncbi:Dihydropteroate synthase-like protein [Fimicolochytrium jonesii]|uniref:Dihydropteroate synthase-like protein n=1 Tax=Fimicolochytrium jonesii TaxID=1396493 RepID=UPI0022FDB438|nr:Dihydropteroate synthase-like protein [Fimicolochytrium jonesii]KAI8821327.1 Dihydropteroate synthase-like protein [Fimicolochytrium jonesii]